MDPKLMIEINEKRKYVLESRDGGIKYFVLHWKPHSELLLKPQVLRKPCISTYSKNKGEKTEFKGKPDFVVCTVLTGGEGSSWEFEGRRWV